jgi:hypothetical protein
MNKQTITFNKSNWSGETATIEVTELAGAYTWEQYGYEIEVSGRKEDDDFVSYEIKIDGEPSDCKVSRFENDAAWNDRRWEATDCIGDCIRGDENLVIAAAQLLYNIL